MTVLLPFSLDGVEQLVAIVVGGDDWYGVDRCQLCSGIVTVIFLWNLGIITNLLPHMRRRRSPPPRT